MNTNNQTSKLKQMLLQLQNNPTSDESADSRQEVDEQFAYEVLNDFYEHDTLYKFVLSQKQYDKLEKKLLLDWYQCYQPGFARRLMHSTIVRDLYNALQH